MSRDPLALKVCLVVFDSNIYGCLVGEVVFSRGESEVLGSDVVDFMIGLRCVVVVDCDLILCFLISIVCCGGRTRDIILRIF